MEEPQGPNNLGPSHCRWRDGDGLGFPLACHQGLGAGEDTPFILKLWGPRGLTRMKLSCQQQRGQELPGSSRGPEGRIGDRYDALPTVPLVPRTREQGK